MDEKKRFQVTTERLEDMPAEKAAAIVKQRKDEGQAAAIAQIKQEAGRRIETYRPAWRQRNEIAATQAVLYQFIMEAPQFTDEQKATLTGRLAGGKVALDYTTAVRKRSGELEAAELAGETVDWSAGTVNGAGNWPSEPSA